MDALVAFVAQFAYIFLIGFQSACIRDSTYKLVFFNSICIGIANLAVVGTVVKGVVDGNAEWYVLTSFVLGGAFGVLCSLYLADHLRKRRESK